MGVTSIAHLVRERHAAAVVVPGDDAEAARARYDALKAPTRVVFIDSIFMLTTPSERYGTDDPFMADDRARAPSLEDLARGVARLVGRLIRSRPLLARIVFGCDMMWNVPLLKQEEWARRNASGWRKWLADAVGADPADAPMWTYSAAPGGRGFSPLDPANAASSGGDLSDEPLGGALYSLAPTPAAMLTDRTLRAFVFSFVFTRALDLLAREGAENLGVPPGAAVFVEVAHPLFRANKGAPDLFTMLDPDPATAPDAYFAPNVLHLQRAVLGGVPGAASPGRTPPARFTYTHQLHIGEADIQTVQALDEAFAPGSAYRAADVVVGVEVHNNDSDLIPILLLAHHGLVDHGIAAGKEITLWSGGDRVVHMPTLYASVARAGPVPPTILLWLLANDSDFAGSVPGMPRSIAHTVALLDAVADDHTGAFHSRAATALRLVYTSASIFPSEIDVDLDACMRLLALSYALRAHAKSPVFDADPARFLDDSHLFEPPGAACDSAALCDETRAEYWRHFHDVHGQPAMQAALDAADPDMTLHSWRQYEALRHAGPPRAPPADPARPHQTLGAGAAPLPRSLQPGAPARPPAPASVRFPFPGYVAPRALLERAAAHAWTIAYWLAGHRMDQSTPRAGAVPGALRPDARNQRVLALEADTQLYWLYGLAGYDVRVDDLGRARLIALRAAPHPILADVDAGAGRLRIVAYTARSVGPDAPPRVHRIDDAFRHTNLALSTAYPLFPTDTLAAIARMPSPSAQRVALEAHDALLRLKDVELVAIRALDTMSLDAPLRWRTRVPDLMFEYAVPAPGGGFVLADAHLCFVLAEVELLGGGSAPLPPPGNQAADQDAGREGGGGGRSPPQGRSPPRLLMMPPSMSVYGGGDGREWRRMVWLVARQPLAAPSVVAGDAALGAYWESAAVGAALGATRPVVATRDDDTRSLDVNAAALVTEDGVYAGVQSTVETAAATNANARDLPRLRALATAARGDAAKFYHAAACRAAPFFGRLRDADAVHALTTAGAPPAPDEPLWTNVVYDFGIPWERAAYDATISSSLRVADYALPLLRRDAGASWARLAPHVSRVGRLMEAACAAALETNIAASAHQRAGSVPGDTAKLTETAPTPHLRAAASRTWLFAYLRANSGDPAADPLVEHDVLARIQSHTDSEFMLNIHRVLPPMPHISMRLIADTGVHVVYFHPPLTRAHAAIYITHSEKRHSKLWDTLRARTPSFRTRFVYLEG